MSTLLYAHLTSQREKAPPTTSTRAAQPGEPPEAGKPGVSGFVDAMAALVPAEVLTAHGILIGLGTTTDDLGDGKTKTTITDPTALKVLFIALALTTIALYVLSRLHQWDPLDFARMLIPAVAFIAWTALQRATMFDAWFPSWSELARTGTAIIVALLLGAIAYALSYKADDKQTG